MVKILSWLLAGLPMFSFADMECLWDRFRSLQEFVMADDTPVAVDDSGEWLVIAS